jgi:hypothetical protein
LIDADGRRPLPPDPAYQQIIKGSPRVDFTMDELLYMPRNMTPDYPVRGVSPVEEIIMTARTIIERQKSQLAFYTEGTLPDSYGEMPEGMTSDSIRAFEDRFNDLLRGNTAMRRGTPFLPAGAKIVPLKQADLKNDADEWFARIVCFCLGIPPTAFIKQMNRSTSDNDKERAQEEGQLPKMQFVKIVIDQLIADFGPEYAANFEFSWRQGLNLDPKEQADVITEYVKTVAKRLVDSGKFVLLIRLRSVWAMPDLKNTAIGAHRFRKVPSSSSSNASRNCSWVFITIGPYQATGSPNGLPETRRNRMPSGPACTSTSSPRSKTTSERLSAADGGAVSSHAIPSVGTASGPEALQNFPEPAKT